MSDIHSVRMLKERDDMIAELQRELAAAQEHARKHVPTLKRIMEAHTKMTLEAMSSGDTYGHRVYSQDADEQCYLCALVTLIEAAQEQLREAGVPAAPDGMPEEPPQIPFDKRSPESAKWQQYAYALRQWAVAEHERAEERKRRLVSLRTEFVIAKAEVARLWGELKK